MSQTLERALRILRFVAAEPRRISSIAAFLGVHHSTALRLLHTMRAQGFVHELADHRYRLGATVIRLGFQALEGFDLRSVARAQMERLNEVTGETIHLGTLEGDEVIYIDKVEARHSVRMYSRIGVVAPLYSAGVAKSILAFLPERERERLLHDRELTARTPRSITCRDDLEEELAEARARGYALDAEENEPGIHCVGAPVFNGAKRVEGAISISAPTSRIDRGTLIGFVPALLAATRAVSTQLGWEPPVAHHRSTRRIIGGF